MMTKTVFQTDRNGVFVGAVEAQESPREEGVYLMPAGAVEIAPPSLNAGEAAVWDGSAWSVAPDHRGEIWFKVDGTSVRVNRVGDPAADGLLAERPEVPASSDPTVNGERNRRLARGFTAVLDAGARSVPVDTRNSDDWSNIQGLVTYAQVLQVTAPATTINFRDGNNDVQTLTPDEMISVGLQALAHKQSHYDAAWALKGTEGGVPADFTDDAYWP